MTRDCRCAVARIAAVLVVIVGVPSLLPAQAAPRAASEDPSRNRETLVQHDSLAVHFLRSPKVKPAVQSRAAAVQTPPAKVGGRHEPVAASAPVETPLPTKKAKPPR